MTKEKVPEILVESLTVRTKGLSVFGQPELKAHVDNPRLVAECRTLIAFLARYISEEGVRIEREHKIAYGYWILKFVSDDNGLEAWELDSNGDEFVRGVNLTLHYWIEQHEVCRKASGEFTPPRPDQLVVVSDGVFEGDAVKAVRYPSPEHMSGWWMTTDRYNGNIDSLRNEHMYHLTAVRPDLARYVCLPYGYRFDFSSTEDIWFDEKVNQEG
jgi:hypothetical protein